VPRSLRSNRYSVEIASAFSLVEVVIAIGVFAFCLLTLMALVPVGLSDNRMSRERMIAADLCTSLEFDLRSTASTGTATPINGIKFPVPSPTASVSATTTLYDGYVASSPMATFSTTNSPTSQYFFTIVLTSAATNTYPRSPVIANIQVTWPAGANPSTAAGTVNTSMAIDRF
jgi:Tfp pilus assembly protein PilV